MRLAALLISCALPAMAQDVSLAFPVDCTLGDTCYVQNYVDHDPTDGATDFQCGDLTYDTHKGTDFGLPSLAAMNDGVDVFAAAPGTVRGTRNTMRDVLYTSDLDGEINGRDCGNGMVVAHDNGWETQYCHLKEGSVSVTVGQQVNTGEVLGQIGLSGRTQFPHLHLSVRHNGAVVDPFDPNGAGECGAPATKTLWADPIDTPQGGILSAGFSADVPDYDAVKAGSAAVLSLSADTAIVLWTFAFGAQPDDKISMTIEGPNGPIHKTDIDLDRRQALYMRASGRRAPNGGWPLGTYTGHITLTRAGVTLDTHTATIVVN